MAAPLRIEAHDGTLFKAASPAGLSYEATTSASSVLEDFFTAYDSSFVLANEKESLAGFAACLALNHGARHETLRARYGPFREYVVVVRGEGNAVVGGMNFIAFPVIEPDGSGHALSLNLNYIFVAPGQRRGGIFKTMAADLPALALALFVHTNPGDLPAEAEAGARSSQARVYIFIEQNDPYRMSPEHYARDSQATGLDQLARIALWGRRGARIIDFDYVQPALSADQEADPTLVYAVLGIDAPTLHPDLLRQHLERFFAISVLKGRDPNSDIEAHRQLAQLVALAAARNRIALLEMKDVSKLPRPGLGATAAGVSPLRTCLAAL
jgi:hypothetical protein